MKRLFIGIGLLAVILAAGLLIPEYLEFCHEPIIDDLDRAAELAMDGEWERTAYLTERAEEKWQEKRPVTAAFTDHEPMDEIDGMFAQLELYADAGDSVAFSGTCVYLVSQLDALGDYHELNFWNLF